LSSRNVLRPQPDIRGNSPLLGFFPDQLLRCPPILPGKMKPERARHYTGALKNGRPNAGRIALTLFRGAFEEFPQNQ